MGNGAALKQMLNYLDTVCGDTIREPASDSKNKILTAHQQDEQAVYPYDRKPEAQ